MKKAGIILAVASVLVLAAAIYAQTGGDARVPKYCAKLPGTYHVTQLVKELKCTKGDKTVKIPHPTEAFPEQSSLAVAQETCELTASQKIESLKLTIPYAGISNLSSKFTLNNTNAVALAMPLSLDINNRLLKCPFQGQVAWDGTMKAKGFLRGQINYTLTKAAGADAACPDACTMTTDFDATAE